MSYFSWKATNLRLGQKGFVQIRNVFIILVIAHLAMLYLGWRNGALPKTLIGIGLFWLGLILLSLLLTGGLWLWDKVKKDPARNQPNTPTLGGDIKIILGLLLTFLSLWAAHGLHKALLISSIVVGSVAGLIILLIVVLLLLPDKPKGDTLRDKTGVVAQADDPEKPVAKP